MTKAIAKRMPSPPPAESPAVVSLTVELTEKDAYALRYFLEFVGGDPDSSPRSLFDKMRVALNGVGVFVPEEPFGEVQRGHPTIVPFHARPSLTLRDYADFDLPGRA